MRYMDSYKKRIADTILQKKLAAKGAVLIESAKWYAVFVQKVCKTGAEGM